MPDTPQKFQDGAVVRLKSGGPRMTVKWKEPTVGQATPQPTYVCQWFENTSLREASFPESSIDVPSRGLLLAR